MVMFREINSDAGQCFAPNLTTVQAPQPTNRANTWQRVYIINVCVLNVLGTIMYCIMEKYNLLTGLSGGG